jgi:hypothetical protein
MIKTEFKVNEEKRIVVCIITTENDVKNRLEKYGLGDEDYDEYDEIRIYKGIALCAPEDEWDETYGRHLAEYRASKMRQIDVNNDIKKFIRGISKCVDNLYDYGMLREPHKPAERRA